MNYMDTRPKTIICDIDGTLVYHQSPDQNAQGKNLHLIDGTLNKINEWERNGHNIILITGRKESMRSTTEQQLSSLGIYYDYLIMGVGGGKRILINDCKENGEEYALAINVKRNKGIKDIQI